MIFAVPDNEGFFFLLALNDSGAAQEDVFPLTAQLQWLAGSSFDLFLLVAVHPSDAGWKEGVWDDPLSCSHSNREHPWWSVITYPRAECGRRDYIFNATVHCGIYSSPNQSLML